MGLGANHGAAFCLSSLSPDPHVLRPEPGSLSEKVSHLESMLRKLQEDLQKVMGVGGGLAGTHRAAPGKVLSTLTPASSPQPPGEGRQGSPGGGGAEPAA